MRRQLRLALFLFLVLAGGAALGAARAEALSFSAKVDYGTGMQPVSVAIGDFDGDGDEDLATANYAENSVSVLLGNGDGTFAATVDYETGTNARAVAVGDFDGDGDEDLAVANYRDNSVSVLLGNGDGTFATKIDHAAGALPFSVAVGDFDGNGDEDLAIANSNAGSVSVLLGNGDGTFADKVDYATGAMPFSVAAGDFNGDGDQDLAAANTGAKTVSVLLGSGDGTFADKIDCATGTTCCSLAVGDFDGDGDEDLATGNYNQTFVNVLLGTGDGAFAAPAIYEIGSSAFSVAVGDFDGDGDEDLASANWGANAVSVLLGNGDGTFMDKADYETGTQPSSIAVGDFDGNGKQDLAAASNADAAVSILLGEWGSPSGTMTIEDDATATASRTVHITSDVSEAKWMRLRNSAGVWTAWQSYVKAATWLLPGGDGEKTVDAQYKGAGTTISISDSIVLDATAPVTTDDAPFGWQTTSPVPVNLSGDDGTGSGVAETQYKFDDASTWTIGTSVEVAGDGVHTIKYRSVDEAGNVEDTSSCTVKLDGTAPVTTVSGADSAWHRTPVTIVFLAADAASGVSKTEYSTDGGTTWNEGTSLTLSDDGVTTIVYRSTDLAGNMEAEQSCSVKIDGTDPTTSDDAPTGWQTASPVTVALTGDDGAGSGVAETQYKLDDASSWSTGTSVAVTGDGAHTIKYRSMDEAGNAGDIESCSVKIDATAPVTSVSGADTSWHRYPVSLAFAAADGASGVATTEYSIDGGATWTQGTFLTTSAEGETTVSYRSTDSAGNVEASKTVTVRVDTKAPTTSGSKVSTRRGKKVVFRVKVSDPAPCSADGAAVTIKIKNAKGKVVKTLSFSNVTANATVSLTWAKCSLRKGTYSYKVYAIDAAGNAQRKAGGGRLTVR